MKHQPIVGFVANVGEPLQLDNRFIASWIVRLEKVSKRSLQAEQVWITSTLEGSIHSQHVDEIDF